MADFQKIHPKREPLEREIAVSSVREDLPVVVGVADDLPRILQRQPSWVRHVQAEFPVLLCADNGRTHNAKNNQRFMIAAEYPRTRTFLEKNRMVKTFRALHHRDFRLLWGGLAVSAVGIWMQIVAQSLLVLKITHGSAFALGSVSISQALAFFLFALVGGSVADRVDKSSKDGSCRSGRSAHA